MGLFDPVARAYYKRKFSDENARQEGFAAGQKAEYDRLWDSLQLNGNRTEYSEAFGSVWSPETFRPKYDLTAEGAYAMFANFSYNNPINMKQILVDAGVQLSFPNSRNISALFQSSAVTHLGELDFSTVTNKVGASLFLACTHLVSIDKLVLPIGQTSFNAWFNSCNSLEHITIEGEIGADISFQWSPLTNDSMKSVITHLKSFKDTDDAFTRTVYFSDDCWANLDAEGNTAPHGGTWRDYVETVLCWNV